MIYTVGKTDLYEECFRTQKAPTKKGRTRKYCGGSVWKFKTHAKKHAPKGFSVYGVVADWEKDTVKSKGGPWHDLLKTSLLKKIK